MGRGVMGRGILLVRDSLGTGFSWYGILLAMAGRVAGAIDNLCPVRSTIGHDAAGGRSKSLRKITIAA